MLLSLGAGVLLWVFDITDPGVAILCALGLEVVIVVHRILLGVERADPIRGMAQAPEIEEALTRSREVLRSGNRPARVLAEQTLSTFVERAKQMDSSGVRLSPQEFMDFADELLDSARAGDRLRATSVLAGGTYWSRAYGTQYEDVNRRASRSGLSIERLYLLRDESHLAEISEILERQAAFSDVRIALLDPFETNDDGSDLRHDFFVFNELVSAEFIFADPNMQIKHISVCTETDTVRRLAREYERIRTLTEPYVPPPAGEGQ
ncbi:MAG TPA: hypothetical protein VJT75_12710 [Thermoleophilaceae bacterium]|nr:hypothetical protein [Thermoleophilaceae bacterium]